MRNKIRDLKEQRARVWEQQRDLLAEAREKGFDQARQSRNAELENELERLTAEINSEERSYERSIGSGSAVRVDERGAGRGIERRLYAPEERLSELVTPTDNANAWLRAMHGEGELRAMNEGTQSAGGYTVPTGFAAQIWDSVRSKSRAVQAGVQTWVDDSKGKDLKIPKVASNADPAWRAEEATVGEDTITFDVATVSPKSLALVVKASFELLQDSNYDLAAFVASHVAKSYSEVLDAAIINGDGTGNAPTGIRNTSGIGSTATVGSPTYGDLSTAYLGIRNNDYEPTAAIMAPRDETTLGNLADSTGQPLNPPAHVARVPMLSTTGVPTNLGTGTNESFILAGQFDQAILGVKLDMHVLTLRERYADTLQIGWIFYGRYDVVVVRPEAFHSLEGVTA